MYTPTVLIAVHTVTKEAINKYEKLIADLLFWYIWSEAVTKELGRLAKGYDITKGIDTIRFLDHNRIQRIPKDRMMICAKIIVDYPARKDDPKRVRITAAGNLLAFPGEVITWQADLTTSKCMWNFFILTLGARYMGTDAGNLYLATLMDRYKCMQIPIKLTPQSFIAKYNMTSKVKNGCVYCAIVCRIHGLPQVGRLANDLLQNACWKILRWGRSHAWSFQAQIETNVVHSPS